jgi:hypothetical protein
MDGPTSRWLRRRSIKIRWWSRTFSAASAAVWKERRYVELHAAYPVDNCTDSPLYPVHLHRRIISQPNWLQFVRQTSHRGLPFLCRFFRYTTRQTDRLGFLRAIFELYRSLASFPYPWRQTKLNRLHMPLNQIVNNESFF